MGRILVVHPQRGLLELIRRVLSDAHALELCERYEPALICLNAVDRYDAVLCSVHEASRTVELFEKSRQHSPQTRLALIARDVSQVTAFNEQWNATAGQNTTRGRLAKAWLPERCTAGEILALFQEPAYDDPPSLEPRAGAAQIPDADLGRQPGLDGYELLGVIGRGGFGTTWMAVNETTGQKVALKIVVGEEHTRQELAALRKYLPVASRSEHLLPIEHVNRDAHRLWVITPLADSLSGGATPDSYQPFSLANRLKTAGHVPELEAVRIAGCLVSGLASLHQAGLLHGDVSPANILRVRERWVLADPGLVRFQGEHGICRDRAYYPQPEVTRAADDLYAVGLILWEMISGVWEMTSGRERLRLDGQMLKFLARKDALATAFLQRAVVEKPEQRYLHADEMLRDLESLAARCGAEPTAPDKFYQLLRPLRTA